MNKTLISHTEDRYQEEEQKSDEEEIFQGKSQLVASEKCTDEPQKKHLRSSTSAVSNDNVKSRSEHVFPPGCIICKKRKAYYYDKVSQHLRVLLFYALNTPSLMYIHKQIFNVYCVHIFAE